MNKFLKRSYFYEFSVISLSIVVSIVLLLFCIKDISNLPFSISVILIVIIVAHIVLRYLKTFGLYLSDGKIYYKTFRKRKIGIESVAAIKVIKASAHTRHGKDADLTNDSGNLMYTMIFLKEYISWRMHQEDLNDVSFRSLFREYILCYTVYDQSVIDYLLTLNPNIIVF